MANEIPEDCGTFVELNVSAEAVVAQHWDPLLENAELMLKQGEFALAIVRAQTACEVLMERGLIRAGIPRREMYSPRRVDVRRLYKELTCDDLEKLPFWQDYLEAVQFRNKSVHEGARLTESAARRGVAATKSLIEHLVGTLKMSK